MNSRVTAEQESAKLQDVLSSLAGKLTIYMHGNLTSLFCV